jgi:hypothetical protein
MNVFRAFGRKNAINVDGLIKEKEADSRIRTNSEIEDYTDRERYCKMYRVVKKSLCT